MKIHTLHNIFDCPAVALVNPVNCVGVMGAGLAKQFKEKYPDYFENYRESCINNVVQLGNVTGYFTKDGKLLISFPTKYHWGERSSLHPVASGVYALRSLITKFSIPSIAIPKVGCGLGGLDWGNVRPIIVRELEKIKDLDLYIPDV